MDMRVGYKRTEIGVIPEDWQLRPLLSTVHIASGQVDPKNEPFRSMILVAPDHVESVTGRLLTRQTAADQKAISGKYLFAKGDIVYSKIRPNLRKAILPDFGGLCSADMYPLKPAKDVSAGFMLAVILGNQFSTYAESVSLRSGMPKINRTEMAGYVVALPPTKAEQEAIAEALSDTDALIESLERLIAKKRQIKQGAMQELLRPKDGWMREKLGDLANIQRGASPRPIDSPIWFDDNSMIGWVRISDVTRSGMFLRETTQRLSPLGVKNSRQVDRGNLIMSICATVGRPIITEIDTCIHDGFVVFDNLRSSKHFLYYILKLIEADWSKHGQTGSQMNLNTGLINQTEVEIPRTEVEQEEIAGVFLSMDAEIAALKAKVIKVRQIKQGMMHNLLTGKIRLL